MTISDNSFFETTSTTRDNFFKGAGQTTPGGGGMWMGCGRGEKRQRGTREAGGRREEGIYTHIANDA